MSDRLVLRNVRLGQNAEPTSMSLEDGKIAAIGSELPRDERSVDLDGRWVLPGLTDSHTHMLAAAQQGLQLSLDHCTSVAEMLGELSATSGTLPEGAWLIAACETLPAELAENRHPTRHELDEVRPARPIVVRALGGHVGFANSAALSEASAALADAPAVEIEEGRLTEQHADALFEACPLPRGDVLAAGLIEEAEAYLRVGVTSAVEAAVGFTNGFDQEWPVWEALRLGSDPFPIRMGFMLRLDPAAALARDLAPGPVELDWQVRTLKFFADGIVGARTAAFHHEYVDCPGHRGEPIYEAGELAEVFGQAHDGGWQIAVHAIGDKAITDVLDAYATCRDSSRRHRIEHLALPTADHLDALAELGLHVATQHGFVPLMGDMFETALGSERAHRLFPTRTLLDRGIAVAGSSDFPIGPRSPLEGINGATRRTTVSGTTFAPGEVIAAAEALDSYLAAGAAISHQEHLRGAVVAGMAADLAAFDEHPATADRGPLAEGEAAMALVRGEIAFSRI